jgi:hypothetical protein
LVHNVCRALWINGAPDAPPTSRLSVKRKSKDNRCGADKRCYGRDFFLSILPINPEGKV